MACHGRNVAKAHFIWHFPQTGAIGIKGFGCGATGWPAPLVGIGNMCSTLPWHMRAAFAARMSYLNGRHGAHAFDEGINRRYGSHLRVIPKA